MWPRGPLVSLRARADTCRTQVPGRDGSRSDRTAGASYGRCEPGGVGRRDKCAERPGDAPPPGALFLCSLAPGPPAPPWAAGPCPAVAGKSGGKWTRCAPPPLCPGTPASVHIHVPLLASGVRQPQPPPLVGSALGDLTCVFRVPSVTWCERCGSHCILRIAASLSQTHPLCCDRSPAGVSLVPLSSKARRRARGGLKASPWHRAGVGGSRGVPSCPEWVQRLLCCQSQPGCGRGPKQPLGLRFSGGCEAGSGDGWEPPVWWPCGWAGADQVWVSGWSRGPWVPGAPVTGAQSDPGQWVGLRLTWRGPGQPHLGPPSGTIPARGFWSDAVCACQALGLPRNSDPALLRRLAATPRLPSPTSNGQLSSLSATRSAVWDLQPSCWCLRKQGELCQNHRLALLTARCRPQAGGARPAPGALGLPHGLARCSGPLTSLPTHPLSPARSPLTGRHGAALCFWLLP